MGLSDEPGNAALENRMEASVPLVGRGRLRVGSGGAVPFAPASRRPKPRSRQISVVIPTLNEAENLWHVLPKLSLNYELIIVDGGSTDGTVDVALAICPDAIVLHQPASGKGDALLFGFMAASGDVIVTLDADGSAKPEEIPRFVEALVSGADFAKGSRFVGDGGSTDLTRIRKLGNRFLCAVVNRLHGTDYTDLCYGYNAFWRCCIPFMPEEAPGFEIETMMHIRIARSGLRVVEVPSYEESRHWGQSNLRAFRDGFKILRLIMSERPRSRRRSKTVPEPTPITIASENGASPALAPEVV
jgi:glycosyltransferase involved in cell wall biosynthesis